MTFSEMKKEIAGLGIPDTLHDPNGERLENKEAWERARKDLVNMIAENCYGKMPDNNFKVTGKRLSQNEDALAGKAVYERVRLRIQGDFPVAQLTSTSPSNNCDFFEFPIDITVPKETEKPPVFISIAFSPLYIYEYLPLEEIIDNGYAVVNFYYQDVAPDRYEDFGKLEADSWGSISKWAWAASRVMDYIEKRQDIDVSRVGVIGGSRLGKTALWAAVCDTRFSVSVPMISGTGGMSFYRENSKETLDDLIRKFPYWFCPNFSNYKGKLEQFPYDANLLAALVAPRGLYLCCADRDAYDDIDKDYLCCVAADEAYGLYGLKGFCAEDRYPQTGDVFQEGMIGYHLRKGTHFMSRYDWKKTMEFRNRHNI